MRRALCFALDYIKLYYNVLYRFLSFFRVPFLIFFEAYAILLGLLAGRQVKEILSQLKHSLPAAMWSSWRFWPFVHMVGG